MIDAKKAHVWLVGGGIASMAAAAFLIRDAGVPGEQIHILEELGLIGGALDGAQSPVQSGYVTRGGRMLEEEAYQMPLEPARHHPLAGKSGSVGLWRRFSPSTGRSRATPTPD